MFLNYSCNDVIYTYVAVYDDLQKSIVIYSSMMSNFDDVREVHRFLVLTQNRETFFEQLNKQKFFH